MPIFEYLCNTCNEVSEFVVLGKDEPLHCTRCGTQDLVKLMSAHNPPASGRVAEQSSVGCCGTPGSCGSPGSCCSG